ncbi:MAG TPA: ABC transporter permease [Bryobacteraceae bacterium]|nr:ABC transporter permease [Bryobacteraceae bacterium]
MSPFAVFCRIREWLRRSEIDHEFEEEIDTHLELARTEYVRRGVAPEEARRLAALKFGKITAVKEAVWEERRLPGPGSFLQDAGYALRDMRKNPGFTLAIVLTLSFGIGLCSVVFSILNGMVLRPLPGVPDPDRLTAIETPVSYPQFENFQKKTGLATAMAAFIGPVPFHVTKGSAAPGRVAGHVVSADYFSTIGVKPLLGRFFEQSDERAAVVVSERFWRTRLQANPKAVGSTLSVNGKDALIIGVGQKEFLGVFPASPADLFVPVSADAVMVPELNNNALHRATDPEFRVLLRLAPRMTLRATEAALDTLTWQMDKQAGKPNEHRYRHIRLMSAGRAIAMPPAGRTSIEFFYGFWVLLLLTLTCANLAGLILARGSTRAREIAIRLSLGARRTRLIQQLLTESLLLAIVAGSAGLGGTYIYFLASAKIGPAKGSNFQIQLQPDWRVLLFTSTISVAAAIGFGLMPALAITRLNLASVLKSGVQFRLGRYRRFGLRNLFWCTRWQQLWRWCCLSASWLRDYKNSCGSIPALMRGRSICFRSIQPATVTRRKDRLPSCAICQRG